MKRNYKNSEKDVLHNGVLKGHLPPAHRPRLDHGGHCAVAAHSAGELRRQPAGGRRRRAAAAPEEGQAGDEEEGTQQGQP